MLLDRLFSIGRTRESGVPAVVADRALENAREFAALTGPWQVAADYGAMPEASLPEIAEVFAREAYNADAGVQASAKAGALQGFKQWLATHPEEPYD